MKRQNRLQGTTKISFVQEFFPALGGGGSRELNRENVTFHSLGSQCYPLIPAIKV